MLRVRDLSGGYDGKEIVKSISFDVSKGEILGILGPNGSGKSTLLKLISGLLKPINGQVEVDGLPISTYSAKAFARKVAVLPQLHAHAFSHTVRETVALGRYPHQSGLFSSWSDRDEQAVIHAMESTAILRYEHQSIELLSGGEQQRVFVAQALAQEAPILLLDEPTNHLDIAHQQQLLDMIQKEAIEKELTVLSIFHDINLASLYCDRLLLLNDGEIEEVGKPQEVIQAEAIQQVYHANVKVQAHPEYPKPQITLLPKDVNQQHMTEITASDFTVSDEQVVLQTEFPLKTLSSAVHNAGIGWYKTFVNRHVSQQYDMRDVQSELADYLQAHAFSLPETVGMMTAALTEYVEIETYEMPFGSVLIAVTAGPTNAVDVSGRCKQNDDFTVGTVNTWVIVNGYLEEEAFIQAVVTATEAKTKAFQMENVKDIATGTSTDSLLIAATQQGEPLPMTPLGKRIAEGVYDCTVRAIHTYKKRHGKRQ